MHPHGRRLRDPPAQDLIVEYHPAPPPRPRPAAGVDAAPAAAHRLRVALRLAAFWHRRRLTLRELYARLAGIGN